MKCNIISENRLQSILGCYSIVTFNVLFETLDVYQ